MGSAIFVHVMRPDRGPTEGCVAFVAEDLRRILSQLDPSSRVVVHPEPMF
jgi:L,D-peptidoglycan transpeptidase YkuD (ErfK/YbiS/YcfS/YnhG family)